MIHHTKRLRHGESQSLETTCPVARPMSTPQQRLLSVDRGHQVHGVG